MKKIVLYGELYFLLSIRYRKYVIYKYQEGETGNISAKCWVSHVTNYTYLLTSWSRVLLEKLTGSAASQQIPRIFRT